MAPLAKHSQDPTIEALLKDLRDAPVVAPSDTILTSLTNHLIGPPSQTRSDSSTPHEHWFCSNADSTTREVATFLIRLHAYDSDRVRAWRSHLRKCLAGCCMCVRGVSGGERDISEYVSSKVSCATPDGLKYIAATLGLSTTLF